MSEIGIEQMDLSQTLHRDALAQAGGWCSWQRDDISAGHDLIKAAFLAFKGPGKELAGFGVYGPVLVRPHELIIGAWSASPEMGSQFKTGEALTKYMEAKNGDAAQGSQTTVSYVNDSPLSAVVTQLNINELKIGGGKIL